MRQNCRATQDDGEFVAMGSRVGQNQETRFGAGETTMIRVHGTSVAFPDGDQWFAVLLRGPSGAGKSDLALRLMEGGARLVADDQTELEAGRDLLMASAPQTLAGRIEVRGLGIMEVEHLAEAPLVLVCDLCTREEVPRMPSVEFSRIAEYDIPMLHIAPFEYSAPIKVRLGVEAARRGILGRTF